MKVDLISHRGILILKGSPPKKGNGAILADQAAKGGSEAGTAVESFDYGSATREVRSGLSRRSCSARMHLGIGWQREARRPAESGRPT
jgi:hypothetical protein